MTMVFLSAILEGAIHSTVQFQEMNSVIFFPFEIHETVNTPLAETDPDMQFYSETIILVIQTVITTWRKCSIIT